MNTPSVRLPVGASFTVTEPAATPGGREAAVARAAGRFYRHRLPVRVMHWINVVCFFILLMSGLQIFNAHPALYWGQASDFERPWLTIGARQTPAGPIGVTRIAGHDFDTDGVLGVSREAGEPRVRAFPAWATIPGPQWLALGRSWHFFFAWIFVINGLAYIGYTLFSRHLQRNLWPTREQWHGIGTSIKEHLLLRHARGAAERRYNVLQQLAYLAVIFVVLPLLVIAGLGMSPRLDSVFNGWVGLLGGRQSARSLHFLAAFLLVLFVAVHLFEVLVSGLWNPLRSMITGYYTLHAERKEKS